jgi:hypothetical protein
LPPVPDWQFLDIETDVKGFKLGVLNDSIFESAKDLVSEVLKRRDQGHRVVCSYNGFKFDNRVLGQLGLLPSLQFGSYTIHYFPGMLNVDLWYWARNHYSDAESKSLSDLCASEGYAVDHRKRRNFDEIRATEDNRMARFLAEKMDVREAWKLMEGLTNVCPLILQTMFLDRTHKSILYAWYLRHDYLPIEYPNAEDATILSGPLRDAIPGIYEKMDNFDVRSAYLKRASSRLLKLYDDEEPPAFTHLMRQFLELIHEYPKQKPLLKFLAVSLVGSQRSDNNFLRRSSIYSEIVEGFSREFANYLSKLPECPVYTHTDGWIGRADVEPPAFEGYELVIKNRYHWVAVYDKQRTLGLLDDSPPQIKAKGFPSFSSNQPLILRKVRDLLYDRLAKTRRIEKLKMILKDPQSFFHRLESTGELELPEDDFYWSSTIWKESEIFPERRDPRSPLWLDWAGLKLGPNRYRWPRKWVLDQIDEFLDQHRLSSDSIHVAEAEARTTVRTGAQ